MKVIFWIATIIMLLVNFMLLQGYINVYYKNYNGGPASSSGAVKYQFIAALILFIAGLTFYCLDQIKIATAIMAIPPALVLIWLLLVLVLPWLLGGNRMQ